MHKIGSKRSNRFPMKWMEVSGKNQQKLNSNLNRLIFDSIVKNAEKTEPQKKIHF